MYYAYSYVSYFQRDHKLSNYIFNIFVYSPNDTRYITGSQKTKCIKFPHQCIMGPRSNVCGILSPQKRPSFDMSRTTARILRHRGESTVVGITLTWAMSLTHLLAPWAQHVTNSSPSKWEHNLPHRAVPRIEWDNTCKVTCTVPVPSWDNTAKEQ